MESKNDKLKLKNRNFNAGSPYSCWLREQMYGEMHDKHNRGLVKKYGIRVTDETDRIIMSVRELDDYPKRLRKVAVEIIRAELDENFEK